MCTVFPFLKSFLPASVKKGQKLVLFKSYSWKCDFHIAVNEDFWPSESHLILFSPTEGFLHKATDLIFSN